MDRMIFCNTRFGNTDEIRSMQVDNGVITKTGDIPAPADAQKTDLCGKRLVPGFAAGVRLVEKGRDLLAVSLAGAKSEAEAVSLLAGTPSAFSRCLIGVRLPAHLVSERLKEAADTLERPALLYPEGGCDCVLNEKAAALLHPENAGAFYDETRGLLKTAARRTLSRVLDIWTPADLEKMILRAAGHYASAGFTSVLSEDLSMGSSWENILDAFLRLDRREILPLRVGEICSFPDNESFARFLDEGYTADVGGSCFRICRYLADLRCEDFAAGMELANMYNMGCVIVPDENTDPEVLEDLIYEGNPLHSVMTAGDQGYERIRKRLMLDLWTDTACASMDSRLLILDEEDTFSDIQRKTRLEKNELLRILSTGTEAAMTRDDIGRLEEGFAADMVLLDEDTDDPVGAVFFNGREITR